MCFMEGLGESKVMRYRYGSVFFLFDMLGRT